MSLIRSSAAGPSNQGGISEFDILKSSHKFLREDDGVDERQLPWDERLAKKYYSSLYREYAVCDLKHYKSGNFALRWRTEEEVLSGAGETTCGNTRCPLHKEFPEQGDDIRPALTTLELPFSYLEHGESKFALVKVVLCPKCVKKLMYKRNKEKEEARRQEARRDAGSSRRVNDDEPRADSRKRRRSRDRHGDDLGHESKEPRRSKSHEHSEHEHTRRREHTSRSRSPRRRTSVATPSP
ncbi:folate-sensitive fragile site protein Fra10Ac1-domain-containing protein [Cubamyces lactineus]|nr:folate-sensitive fragile site protein Fra10Ac1-domain-containing protein [Cubamyces lactineus]